jgi:hypothetical protein
VASITFQWDTSHAHALTNGGVERATARALSKAGGDAARFMRTGSARLVRARKRLKLARVLRSLPLTFPRGKAIEDLVWLMDVSGAAIPLIDYPSRQVKSGVSVAVNAGGRSILKSAFIATMGNGHRGVFFRTGKSRLPIKEAFTTRVSDVFNDAGMIEGVLEGAQAKFAATFERLLPLELDKEK